jgi:hypothetical protein
MTCAVKSLTPGRVVRRRALSRIGAKVFPTVEFDSCPRFSALYGVGKPIALELARLRFKEEAFMSAVSPAPG